MYRPSSGAVTAIATMSAASCAHPATDIRTAPGRRVQRRGTRAAAPPGPARRCSLLSLHADLFEDRRFALVVRVEREIRRFIRTDDAVTRAYEHDAQREETEQGEHDPHVRHTTPRFLSVPGVTSGALASSWRSP